MKTDQVVVTESTVSNGGIAERLVSISVGDSNRFAAIMQGNATVKDGQTDGGYEASGSLTDATALEFLAAYTFAGGDPNAPAIKEALALLATEHGLDQRP